MDGYTVQNCFKQFAAQTLDVSTSRQGDNGVGIAYAAVLGYREVILRTCLCQSLRADICTSSCCIITRHDRQCMCKHNIEARSSNHSYRGRTKVRHILCVCVCVCVCVCSFSYWACKTHAPYSIVCSLFLPHFPTLSHKRHDFRGKVIDHKMCVLIFSITFLWYICHINKNSARYCHEYT
jgi:hypothetical protein